MIYIPANENLCTELTGEVPKYVLGERFMGVAKNVLKIVAGADHIGELQAWNIDTGKGPQSGHPVSAVRRFIASAHRGNWNCNDNGRMT